jgi:peroxiredoxin Q/BCP
MALLSVGDKAPAFKTNRSGRQAGRALGLQGKEDRPVLLSEGRHAGCTKEACNFRDAWPKLRRKKVEVLGVSVDDAKSHRKFADKYSLPFTLLADTDKKIVNDYGVWGEKSLYGRKFMGTNRVTT